MVACKCSWHVHSGVTGFQQPSPLSPNAKARGFSFLALCFSVGLFLGPILGGELLDPEIWLPVCGEATEVESCVRSCYYPRDLRQANVAFLSKIPKVGVSGTLGPEHFRRHRLRLASFPAAQSNVCSMAKLHTAVMHEHVCRVWQSRLLVHRLFLRPFSQQSRGPISAASRMALQAQLCSNKLYGEA